MKHWEFTAKIDKIIDDNTEEIAYEGTKINKYAIAYDIILLIKELSYSDLEEIQKMEI